ncbi:hypothetical protein AB0I66_34840 [Streptomyces sp. NPDC050439]|uniref:hypothetical protein n=1 Tax=unclassified Streptomyces TaxID=2593676 RepID=UPI00341BB9FD
MNTTPPLPQAPPLTSKPSSSYWSPADTPAAALLNAAAQAGLTVTSKTAGPSRIGNLLAGEGISATAGFGVPYTGLRGIGERAHLAELPTVHAVYQRAVVGLLESGARRA